MTITPKEYDPTIPSPKDTLAFSQTGFLPNFSQLYDIFSNNHVALDAGSTAGNHNFIELVTQIGDIQTNLDEISVYTKTVEGQGEQLFLRFQGNGTEAQISNYQIYSLIPTANQEQYFTFLPGKIIVYFGTLVTKFANPGPNDHGPPLKLPLSPAIAKHIMTVNVWPIGDTGSMSPFITLQYNEAAKCYDVINLYQSSFFSPVNNSPGSPTKIGYIVLANI